MEFVPSDDVARIKARLDHPVIDSDGHAIEYLPLVRDILREQAGESAAVALDAIANSAGLVRNLTSEQRRAAGVTRTSWWGLPARNTLDRGTAMLPALLAQRLGEMGIDHAVLYPTYGLVPAALEGQHRQIAARPGGLPGRPGVAHAEPVYLNHTVASGGRITRAEAGRPAQGPASAWTEPRFPTPLPE